MSDPQAHHPPDTLSLSLGLEPAAARALTAAEVGDPFALLGPHRDRQGVVLRVWLPGALAVVVVGAERGEELGSLAPQEPAGLFAARFEHLDAYRLRIRWPEAEQETEDPYAFGMLLAALDLHLIAEGRHLRLTQALGAQAMVVEGIAGVRFAVWAPNARRVSVVGDFNSWDPSRLPMRLRQEAGVWELFVPRLQPGARYKFALLGAQGPLPYKADPVAQRAEAAPATGSVVADPTPWVWTDTDWCASRSRHATAQAPMSIYELHAGSWRRGEDGRALDWRALAEQLVGYVADLGFTHVELLPITAYPFGGSWGYQPLGLFAPHEAYGGPQDFAYFVDRCHAAGIGVILDWVPAHFPVDEHGLAWFDGTALYEHADPREGFHPDWNSAIYNLGRNEVRGFLLASALHWLRQYHVDGLRVDAVASMLYRDYSRREGEWIPNRYGGRENLEAIAFLRELCATVQAECPGALMIAEESTAWPGVTQAVDTGGLGFSYKWNMGWMHDTLHFFAQDPVHRRWHHHDLTFSLMYAYSERYVLPFSHDEVVHLKRSMLGKMPGDRWQQFANLRCCYGWMWAHPGKKLLFMGGELAQPGEWSHESELPWPLLDDPFHHGVQALVRDLNALYRQTPALHRYDAQPEGFRWAVVDDHDNSVYAFVRTGTGSDAPVLVVVNATPVPRHGYRIGVPQAGRWHERLNTDARRYGGSGMEHPQGFVAEAVHAHGAAFSLVLELPPLATMFLQLS